MGPKKPTTRPDLYFHFVADLVQHKYNRTRFLTNFLDELGSVTVRFTLLCSVKKPTKSLLGMMSIAGLWLAEGTRERSGNWLASETSVLRLTLENESLKCGVWRLASGVWRLAFGV
jgi:hypothetical protein